LGKEKNNREETSVTFYGKRYREKRNAERAEGILSKIQTQHKKSRDKKHIRVNWERKLGNRKILKTHLSIFLLKKHIRVNLEKI